MPPSVGLQDSSEGAFDYQFDALVFGDSRESPHDPALAHSDAVHRRLRSEAEREAKRLSIQVTWTPEDTWQAFKDVFSRVRDDDTKQPHLLAAKILMGFYTVPDLDTPVPFAKDWTFRDLFMGKGNPPKPLRYETSVTARKRLAGLLYGEPNEGAFRSGRVNERRSLVREAVKQRVLAQVSWEVRRRAGLPVGDAAISASAAPATLGEQSQTGEPGAASRSRRLPWKAALLITGGVLTILAVAAAVVIPTLTGGPTATPPSAGQDASAPSAPATTTPSAAATEPAPAPVAAPLPPSDGTCPAAKDAQTRPRVEIEVYWWCTGNAITDDGNIDITQLQLKVRLGIAVDDEASSEVNVGISRPSAIRLLVPYTPNLIWHPPPKTDAAGDEPTRVNIAGAAYWAIPPNVNDDWQEATVSGEDGTSISVTNFASHWDPAAWGFPDGILEPGESIGDASRAEEPTTSDKRGNTSTDLVFTMPVEAYEAVRGIALFDTSSGPDSSEWVSLGICEQTDGCMSTANQIDPAMF